VIASVQHVERAKRPPPKRPGIGSGRFVYQRIMTRGVSTPDRDPDGADARPAVPSAGLDLRGEVRRASRALLDLYHLISHVHTATPGHSETHEKCEVLQGRNDVVFSVIV